MENSLIFSNALVVSPPSQYVNLVAGESHSGTISITNPSNSTGDMEFYVSVIPYGVNVGDYTTDFSSDTIYNDIVEWVSVDKDHGQLAPNETATITYTINTPAEAPAGGQYCAIAIRNTNDNTSETVNEVIEIASVIYARVAGEVREDGKLLDSSVPSIVFTPPVASHLSFSNAGNVHLNATINTKITNFFDDEEVLFDSREYDTPITETIMPETTRSVSYTFDGMPELGILNFYQTIVYNGEKTELSQSIFVCPIWFIVLVLVTIAAIVAVIVRGVRRHKKQKSNNLV